jgi:hypothetical protein
MMAGVNLLSREWFRNGWSHSSTGHRCWMLVAAGNKPLGFLNGLKVLGVYVLVYIPLIGLAYGLRRLARGALIQESVETESIEE